MVAKKIKCVYCDTITEFNIENDVTVTEVVQCPVCREYIHIEETETESQIRDIFKSIKYLWNEDYDARPWLIQAYALNPKSFSIAYMLAGEYLIHYHEDSYISGFRQYSQEALKNIDNMNDYVYYQNRMLTNYWPIIELVYNFFQNNVNVALDTHNIRVETSGVLKSYDRIRRDCEDRIIYWTKNVYELWRTVFLIIPDQDYITNTIEWVRSCVNLLNENTPGFHKQMKQIWDSANSYDNDWRPKNHENTILQSLDLPVMCTGYDVMERAFDGRCNVTVYFNAKVTVKKVIFRFILEDAFTEPYVTDMKYSAEIDQNCKSYRYRMEAYPAFSKISIEWVSILLTDGTVIECEQVENLNISPASYLEKEFMAKFGYNDVAALPDIKEDYWVCTCGACNAIGRTSCKVCDTNFEDLNEKFFSKSPKLLLNEFVQEKKELEEKREREKREKEETARKRREEEQNDLQRRIDEENKKREIARKLMQEKKNQENPKEQQNKGFWSRLWKKTKGSNT